MLGRLFASNAGSSAGSFKSSSTVHGAGKARDDDGSKPVSLLEEADTRSLLYGSSSSLASETPVKLSGKDVRVVVIVDMNAMDDYVYDSNRSEQASAYLPPSATAPRRPSHNRRATVGGGVSSSYESTSSKAQMVNVSPAVTKDVLFGSTPIRYISPITKLHEVGHSEDKTKKTWIMSRLFKIGATGEGEDKRTVIVPDDQRSVPLSVSQDDDSGYDSQSFSSESESDEDDPNPWKPKCTATNQNFKAFSQEYRCGVCVFFNLPAESDALTTHWDELSIAMSDLQQEVSSRLREIVPRAIKSLKRQSQLYGYSAPSNMSALRKRLLNLDGNENIKSAVDYFKTRFFGVVRIPRVLCGQARWPELLAEVKIMFKYLDNNQEDGFLSTILASFIKCNQDLINRRIELTAGALGRNPPTRTVVMGNSRIPSRRLIFILTSLIHDKSCELQTQQIQQMSWAIENDSSHDNSTDQPKAASISSCNNSSAPSSPASRNSRVSSGTAAQLSDKGGWEIPKAVASPGESTSTCTMPHVIRPTFSSSSLSNSMTSNGSVQSQHKKTWQTNRYPSMESLRKNFFGLNATPSNNNNGGIFTGSGSNASFLSSLWTPSSSINTSRTSEDGSYGSYSSTDDWDYPGMVDNGYGDLSTSLPSSVLGGRPEFNRWNSTDQRTATMLLSPTMRQASGEHSFQVSDDDDDDDDYDDNDQGEEEEEIHYGLVQEEDGSFVMEVQPIEFDAVYEPIVLPPIAGHIPQYHPDFGIQATPMNRDLEEKIAHSMIRDADRKGADVSGQDVDDGGDGHKQRTQVVSRTLIINLKKREIYEWELKRTTVSGKFHQQYLQRQKLYSGKKPIDQYSQWSRRVGQQFRRVVTLVDEKFHEEEAVETLKQGYLNAFGLVH